jgi:hypothetical protein
MGLRNQLNLLNGAAIRRIRRMSCRAEVKVGVHGVWQLNYTSVRAW